VGVIVRTMKWARRRPTLATLVALLAITLGAGVWFYHQESSRQADAAERRIKARLGIESSIEQAYKLGKAKRLQEASLLLAEPGNHLTNADSDELRERLERASAEVQFVQDLVEVQQATSWPPAGVSPCPTCRPARCSIRSRAG